MKAKDQARRNFLYLYNTSCHIATIQCSHIMHIEGERSSFLESSYYPRAILTLYETQKQKARQICPSFSPFLLKAKTWKLPVDKIRLPSPSDLQVVKKNLRSTEPIVQSSCNGTIVLEVSMTSCTRIVYR